MKRTSLVKILSLWACCFSAVGASGDTVSSITGKLNEINRRSRDLALQAEIEAKNATARWNHAKELLGRYYQKSVVQQQGEQISSLDQVLSGWVEHRLKGKWKKEVLPISRTILEVSGKYQFDPIFLLAVIESESSFNPEAIGSVGEIGLMQLTPQTGAWIARKTGFEWKGRQTLANPVANIQLGAAYLAYLREKFEFQSQLYISAYNMGSRQVLRAVERNIWPKEYASRVMHRYVNFYAKLKNVNKAFN